MLNIYVFRFLGGACTYAVNKGRGCSSDFARGKESNSFSPSLGTIEQAANFHQATTLTTSNTTNANERTTFLHYKKS